MSKLRHGYKSTVSVAALGAGLLMYGGAAQADIYVNGVLLTTLNASDYGITVKGTSNGTNANSISIPSGTVIRGSTGAAGTNGTAGTAGVAGATGSDSNTVGTTGRYLRRGGGSGGAGRRVGGGKAAAG